MRDAPPRRADLRAHLIARRIAGEVDTPRATNLAHAARCAARDPHYLFGLEPSGRWSYRDVVALMAARCGIRPDVGDLAEPDRIDPDLTLDRLDDMAARLAQAARERQPVLVATGHPSGVFVIHAEVVRALRAAGCEVMTPGDGLAYVPPDHPWDHGREIRFVAGVGMVSSRGHLHHTHSPAPMVAMLAARADAGLGRPALVIADHGMAGAAGQAGLDVVGFADCNDPGLFVGEAEGRVRTVVPLDDNVLPVHYEPLALHLVAAIHRSRSQMPHLPP